MDVRMYFSKYGQRVYLKYGNQDVNECEFVASEVDGWALMELSLVDILIFQAISGLKYTASPDWLKKFF